MVWRFSGLRVRAHMCKFTCGCVCVLLLHSYACSLNPWGHALHKWYGDKQDSIHVQAQLRELTPLDAELLFFVTTLCLFSLYVVQIHDMFGSEVQFFVTVSVFFISSAHTHKQQPPVLFQKYTWVPFKSYTCLFPSMCGMFPACFLKLSHFDVSVASLLLTVPLSHLCCSEPSGLKSVICSQLYCR